MNQQDQPESPAIPQIVGSWMREVAKSVEWLANMKKRIIFSGPTGVGKEILSKVYAEKLAKQLTALNCTEFTDELIASELFGHTKSAFTGATDSRKGVLVDAATANQIVLLDEFQEMPPNLQARLLRFLEVGEYRKVGSDKIEKLKGERLCLVATSNASAMRPDIMYRFDYHLRIPPLESRTFPSPEDPVNAKPRAREYGYSEKEINSFSAKVSDLAETIEHCLITSSAKNHKVKYIAEGALAHIYFRRWPGNFRQMDKYIGLAATLTERRRAASDTILERDLPEQVPISNERINHPNIPYGSKEKIEIKKEGIFAACERMHRQANIPRDLNENGDIVFVRETLGERMTRFRKSERPLDNELEGLLHCKTLNEAKEAGILLWLKHNPKRVGESATKYQKRLGIGSPNTYNKYKGRLEKSFTK